jgi:hypothetical protein
MVSITIVIASTNMRQTFEDRLELLSSTTLDNLATAKEHLAEQLESQGIRSKNNSRVAIKIRVILEKRGWHRSPAGTRKSSTTRLSGRKKRAPA